MTPALPVLIFTHSFAYFESELPQMYSDINMNNKISVQRLYASIVEKIEYINEYTGWTCLLSYREKVIKCIGIIHCSNYFRSRNCNELHFYAVRGNVVSPFSSSPYVGLLIRIPSYRISPCIDPILNSKRRNYSHSRSPSRENALKEKRRIALFSDSFVMLDFILKQFRNRVKYFVSVLFNSFFVRTVVRSFLLNQFVVTIFLNEV